MSKDITQLLQNWSQGDDDAGEDLYSMIYDELHRIAAGYMRDQPIGHTLQPTALVNEAFCRLQAQREWNWLNRRHFYAIAAKMMRRALVDHARRQASEKRGGAWRRVDLEDSQQPALARPGQFLALDLALSDLERVDEVKCKIVELRFFAGLSQQEISETLEISTATVHRQWAAAKAWLYRDLENRS